MLERAAIAVNETPTRALRGAANVSPVLPNENAPLLGVAVARHPKQPLPGYELGQQIGAGGMGTVFKAVHTWLGRTVAVKFIAKEALADPEAIARFAHESRAIGRLDHPNIVRAMDAGCVGGRHFLVTEFVDGCDLGRLVKATGPLRIADGCEIIRQAALGLEHAREQQLVHRDVKPTNLLLSRGGMVKLLDFGLARLATNQTALTTTGQMIGTLDFLAPEQASDARQVDIRSDIYSLGCTFYFLLTGKPPFGGPEYESPASKIKAHLADDPPRPMRRRGRIPLGVLGCLERMMAKSPADRYQTPAEIAAALAPHARGTNLRPLVAAATGLAEPDAASRADDDSVWSAIVWLAGLIPSIVGWMFRRIFTRRATFQGRSRREPILSIGGIVALIVVALILSHFSCVPQPMPGNFREGSGPEIHYFRFGPDPAERP